MTATTAPPREALGVPWRGQRRPDDAVPAPRARGRGLASLVALAAVVYGPLLLTAPGQVGADTKQYLYLDPGRLLAKATSLWDPGVGLGTVTHQNIGYLWPMGPWYWVMDRLGVPEWVAQRLWLATVLFAAGAGVLFLLRVLGNGAPALGYGGGFAAALVYMLSPYGLAYAARISAILLPWAGLPWLIGLMVMALRRGGWRHPALFALVVTTVGSINATAVAFAGLGALLWVPFAVWGLRETTPRRAAGVLVRTGLLVAVTQLWWVVALLVDGRYGTPVLQTTETVEAVSTSSLASEVARGLGNWFFYGRDSLGPWVEASMAYTQQAWLILISFSLPVLALVASAVTRWRFRAYFALLAFVGGAIGVAAYPFDDPAPLGAAFRSVAESSNVGLALRNAQRAVPLLVLGLAVLLGAGVAAAGRRVPRGTLLAGVLVAFLALADFPPLFEGTLVDRNLRRPEEIPDYWQEALVAVGNRGDGTRILEVPGSDFASYRWGDTVDPVTPGLLDRPYVAREAAPLGAPGSIDLLAAFDRRFQEGLLEPQAIAPVARLFAAGDVLYRADLQYERYRTPRPRALWSQLQPAPPGLGPVEAYGAPVRAVPEVPLNDEQALGLPPDAADPPPVAVFPVEGAPPVVRAVGGSGALLLAGDGEGVVDAAAAGLLDAGPLVVYSGEVSDDPAVLDRLVGGGAGLVLTDSNRRRARRFTGLRENTGHTEQAGEQPLVDDPADARLDLFPGRGDDVHTVTQLVGAASVRASGYGNVVTYTPEDRPALALDGDLSTAWRVGALGDPTGQRVVVDLGRPRSIAEIGLVQPLTGPRNRWITRVRVRFDGDVGVVVDLSDASRTAAGQRLAFPPRQASRVELEVEATNVGRRPSYDELSAVGFAEVDLGARTAEQVRLPTDLLDAVGDRSADLPLTVLLARLRANPAEPVRADEERALDRTFRLPTERVFDVQGTARVSAAAPDELVDRTLGRTGVVARSSDRLPGALDARASSAVDDDPGTHWSPGLGPQEGRWVEVELGAPVTLDRLDLTLVADGRHSVPTRVRLDDGAGQTRVVDVPAVVDRPGEDATVTVPVRFAPMTVTRLRLTVEAVRVVTSRDYYSGTAITLPVGVAELGVAGAGPAPALDAGCRSDLLTVDGRPVPVRLEGTPAQARTGLGVRRCGPPVTLGAGDHVVRTAPGAGTGIDLDRLVLASGPPVAAPGPVPTVTVRAAGRTHLDLDVAGIDGPFWLVLGQSRSDGWEARVDGGPSLGRPVLVDGYANGWWVEPGAARTLSLSLAWTPQAAVRLGLGASAAGAVVCLALALFDPRRRRRRGARPPEPAEPPVFASPFRRDGPRPRPAVTVVAVLVTALAVGLAAGPVLGGVVAGATAVALLTRWGRTVLTVGSVVALAAAGAYTAYHQVRYGPPPGFTWARTVDRAHVLGWLALALLAGDGLVQVLTWRRRTSVE